MLWSFSEALDIIRTTEEPPLTDAATTVQYDASTKEHMTTFPDGETKTIHTFNPSVVPFFTRRN